MEEYFADIANAIDRSDQLCHLLISYGLHKQAGLR